MVDLVNRSRLPGWNPGCFFPGLGSSGPKVHGSVLSGV